MRSGRGGKEMVVLGSEDNDIWEFKITLDDRILVSDVQDREC